MFSGHMNSLITCQKCHSNWIPFLQDLSSTIFLMVPEYYRFSHPKFLSAVGMLNFVHLATVWQVWCMLLLLFSYTSTLPQRNASRQEKRFLGLKSRGSPFPWRYFGLYLAKKPIPNFQNSLLYVQLPHMMYKSETPTRQEICMKQSDGPLCKINLLFETLNTLYQTFPARATQV